MALRAGAIRFNTDLSQMEIYDGNQWTGVVGDSPELHTGGTRGLWAGGEESGKVNRIQFVIFFLHIFSHRLIPHVNSDYILLYHSFVTLIHTQQGHLHLLDQY